MKIYLAPDNLYSFADNRIEIPSVLHGLIIMMAVPGMKVWIESKNKSIINVFSNGLDNTAFMIFGSKYKHVHSIDKAKLTKTKAFKRLTGIQ